MITQQSPIGSGSEIRIFGNNGVDLRVYFVKQEDGSDRFSISLCMNGMEYGCGPSFEVTSPDKIIVQNNLTPGRSLYR